MLTKMIGPITRPSTQRIAPANMSQASMVSAIRKRLNHTLVAVGSTRVVARLSDSKDMVSTPFWLEPFGELVTSRQAKGKEEQ